MTKAKIYGIIISEKDKEQVQKTRKENFMTQKEMLEKIINGELTDEVKEKAKEILASAKRRDDKRAEKTNENRSNNSAIAKELYNGMKNDRWYAVSEIIECIIPETTMDKNKVSAIMLQGVKDGIFEDTKEYKIDGKGDKKKGYRKIAIEDTDTEDTEN